METEKMIKTARGLDKLCRVLQVIAMVGAAVCIIILGVFTLLHATGHGIMQKGFDLVDIGPLTFKLTQAAALDNTAVLGYAWLMAAAAVAAVAVIYYALGIIRKIFAPMTQGDPFHPTVGQKIRKLAFASLAIGVIQNVMGAIETLGALRLFQLNSWLQNGRIESVTANFRCDLSFIVWFFVLLLLSYVFRYGAMLQKLSDETL